jgi:hypothetical protein
MDYNRKIFITLSNVNVRVIQTAGAIFLCFEYKHFRVSNSWVECRHIRNLFFDLFAISVEAFFMAVDEREK